jgi:hypothetical protein
VFERAKIFHALGRAATVIGRDLCSYEFIEMSKIIMRLAQFKIYLHFCVKRKAAHMNTEFITRQITIIGLYKRKNKHWNRTEQVSDFEYLS